MYAVCVEVHIGEVNQRTLSPYDCSYVEKVMKYEASLRWFQSFTPHPYNPRVRSLPHYTDWIKLFFTHFASVTYVVQRGALSKDGVQWSPGNKIPCTTLPPLRYPVFFPRTICFRATLLVQRAGPAATMPVLSWWLWQWLTLGYGGK